MKKIFILLFLAFSLSGFSATRYLVGGGDGNWNSSSNWSSTSGGTSGASVPIAGDAVVIDTNSANTSLSVNVTSACASVTVSNAYSGTLSVDAVLTTTGAVTLGSNMNLSGASQWTMNTGCTITCAGKSFPALNLGGASQTFTLADTLRVAGLLTLNGTTATTFSGSYGIKCAGLTITNAKTVTSAAAILVTGGTTISAATTCNGSFTLYTGGLAANAALGGSFNGIVLNGKGSWSGSGSVSAGITINTADTLTLSGTISSTGALTNSAGTVICSGSILNKSGSFGPGSTNWNNIVINGSTTLSANCNVAGNLTVSASTTINGAFSYNVAGSFTYSANNALTGTSAIVMNGKGTISVTQPSGAVSVPFTINSSDTITFGSTFRINNCNFTYISGAIVSTGSVFETSGTASTIAINGAGFNVATYQSSISQSFGGSNGFTIKTFSCPASGRTFTFAAGKTYLITNEISVAGTAASHCAFVSGTPGTKAIVTLQQGASEDLGFCNATDINSSAGKSILSYKGTLSNCDNWNLVQTTPREGAFTFN